MKDKNNRKALGLAGVTLAAVLLTVLANIVTQRLGGAPAPLPSYIWISLAVIGIGFCWWLYASLRLYKMVKRLNAAGSAYQASRDADAYLAELDACGRMPGARSGAISGVPARDFLVILKLRTLQEAGRGEEALALLRAARQDLRGEKAQELLDIEEEKLLGQGGR